MSAQESEVVGPTAPKETDLGSILMDLSLSMGLALASTVRELTPWEMKQSERIKAEWCAGKERK